MEDQFHNNEPLPIEKQNETKIDVPQEVRGIIEKIDADLPEGIVWVKLGEEGGRPIMDIESDWEGPGNKALKPFIQTVEEQLATIGWELKYLRGGFDTKSTPASQSDRWQLMKKGE